MLERLSFLRVLLAAFVLTAFVLPVLVLPALVDAQIPESQAAPQAEPKGPAEVFQRAQEARDAPRLPADHPPIPADHPPLPPAQTQGLGGEDRADDLEVSEESVRDALIGVSLASAEPDDSVDPGEILVQVIDEKGAPLAGMDVRLGVMVSDGSRRDQSATTDERGLARFTELATGTNQAYRVSIGFDGARVGADPFRLEPDRGYKAILRRASTTQDARYLLQALASTQIEFRQEGRVRITQGARLFNPTRSVYVFPEGGREIRLPPGFIAFQSRASMSDQRLIPNEHGFRVEGSVPPGYHELVWSYDLPLKGSELLIRMPATFPNTMAHRVVSDFVEGMSMEVEGITQVFSHTMGGKRLFIAERRMAATDFPLDELKISLSGIPDDASWKLYSVGLASLIVLLGLAGFFLRRGRKREVDTALQEARMAELINEVRALDKEREAGEIGPEYHAREREELVAEMAELLAARPDAH